MNREDAQKLIESEISRLQDPYDPIECVVLEDETIEKPWGWVFFYQSKAYLESGDFRDMVGGNAPYIVNRQTGAITETGTAHDIEHYINEYEAAL
ncbi:YrhB domain-containing protein [Microbulbifer aggregans]|uniref:YrhB domain-containing protein n=1 Tax=Microbulbifer aggregans TaxID=1769779 RepID=UPI001CFD8C99|nr:YrhB domain-containing protein [Microbulbifer aggregans]